MINHGLPKLTGGPETWAKLGDSMGNVGIHFAPVIWGFLAALSEAVGGLFTILGLWFRPVCIFIIITMVVAAMHHFAAKDGLSGASSAITVGAVYLGLLFIGPGTYSVDRG
jgi:putative oxidoreductase